jgi:hypothetical protein
MYPQFGAIELLLVFSSVAVDGSNSLLAFLLLVVLALRRLQPLSRSTPFTAEVLTSGEDLNSLCALQVSVVEGRLTGKILLPFFLC